MYSWLDVDAFKHQDNRTHKVLQFLQEARMPVMPTAGVWNLWYDAVANAPLARDVCELNITKEKKEPVETGELEVEVDESQFSRRSTPQK